MTSFVSWLLTGLTPLLLAGRAGDAPVSRGLAARVAERIAGAWRVPVGQVRLLWGHSSGTASPADETTFRVLGRGEDGWFVVVFDPAASTAVAVRVRAGVERPVMVASRSLPAGSRLTDGDLREEMRVHWGVPAADSALTPGTGWEVRRLLAAGEVIAAPAVAPPPLVFAGQPVRMEWQRGGVEVSVVGIALNNARRGETVRARLEERPARLTGTVVAPGTAVLVAEGARR
jgi:flagella basal body P-ring formation protein FlgA